MSPQPPPRWSRRHSWRRMSPRPRNARSRRHSWAPMTSLADASRLLAAGDASPLEVLDACLSHLATAQEHGAFVHIDEPKAPAARPRPSPPATRPAPRHPRRGQGPDRRRRAADRARAERRAAWPSATPRSSPACATQGAVIVGKTRTDELGLGALTPGASDPRDPRRSPGGSSGGSAIAVATGAALLALATDTAGSARIPAAACGVAGLCAAAGWMPTDGVSILAPSFDRLGLIAATAEDLAVAWTALGGTIGEPPDARRHARRRPTRPRRARTPRSRPPSGPPPLPTAARAHHPLTAAVRPSARNRHHRRGRRAPRHGDGPPRQECSSRPAPRTRDADVRSRPRATREARHSTARARSATASSSRPRSPQSRRCGTSSTPPTRSSAPPAASPASAAPSTAHTSWRSAAPQGVQLIARDIETALAAALRLP